MCKRFVSPGIRGVLLGTILLSAGACDSGSVGPASSAQPAASSPFGLVEPSYSATETPAGTTTVYLEGRFLSAPWGLVKKLGLGTGNRAGFLRSEELRKLDQSISAGDVSVAARVALSVSSGQRSYAMTATQGPYVGDFRLVETPAGELTIDPVVSVLTTGCLLDARVRADGTTIVLERVKPQLVEKLGSRVCVAKLPQLGARDPLPLEEPVLLKAVASTEVPMRMRDGEAFLLQLDPAVQQHTAQARAFATDVQETFEAEASPAGGPRVVPRQFFLLLKGTVQGEPRPPE